MKVLLLLEPIKWRYIARLDHFPTPLSITVLQIKWSVQFENGPFGNRAASHQSSCAVSLITAGFQLAQTILSVTPTIKKETALNMTIKNVRSLRTPFSLLPRRNICSDYLGLLPCSN